MTYRRSPAVQRPPLTSSDARSDSDPMDYDSNVHSELKTTPPPGIRGSLKRKAALVEDDEISLFRRVRIKSFVTRRQSDEETSSPISLLQLRIKCPICPLSFTRPEHINRHLRGHNANRPNSCQFDRCGKNFGTIKNLLHHTIYLHQGEYVDNSVTYPPSSVVKGETGTRTIYLSQAESIAFEAQRQRIDTLEVLRRKGEYEAAMSRLKEQRAHKIQEGFNMENWEYFGVDIDRKWTDQWT